MNRVKEEVFNPNEVFKPKTKYYKNPPYFSTLFPSKSASPLKNELEIIEESSEEISKDDVYIDEILFKEKEYEEISRPKPPLNVFYNISPVRLNTIEYLKQEVNLIITLYSVQYEFEKYDYILFEERPDCILIHKVKTISEIIKIVLHEDSMLAILNVAQNKITYFKSLNEFYDFGLLSMY